MSLFNPLYWTGQLQAKSLVKDTAGNYAVQNTANWDASCNLTGGLCESTGNTTVPVQAPNDRVFWTWNGSNGISLDWSNLTAAQKTSLQNANTNVTNTYEAINLARIQRDKTLYKDGTGVYSIQDLVKEYVKGAFGAKSIQYKQMVAIKFTKPKKLFI